MFFSLSYSWKSKCLAKPRWLALRYRVFTGTRDLIIIIGIFTYFTAFVYVHFYYEAFGLSTQSLKIDYASYLAYAYDVVSAPLFIVCAVVLIGLLVFGKMGLRYLLLKRRAVVGFDRKLVRYRFGWRVFELVLLFPFLYYTSRAVARQDYVAARINLKDLKAIQFVFRNSADGLGPAVRLDSLPLATNQLAGDMRLRTMCCLPVSALGLKQ